MQANNRTEFTPVLDHQELEKLPRDLNFYEVRNPSPYTLTADQISQFNRDGCIRGIRIYSDEEIDGIRAYFDRLLAKVAAEGGDSYSISSAHLKYARVWETLAEPRIVACLKDLLGENVVGWGSHFFCKMPGDGKSVAWHQDSSFWPLTPSKAVTVWLAVDDADVANACMRFVAGSHHFGKVTYRPSDPEEHNVLNQTIKNVEQFGRIVENVLKAGEISINSDLLLHGSEANKSERRRCGLTLRYTPAEVQAEMGWNEKGVWVSGKDARRHWSNRSRPATDVV